jgi:hypothetical protein
MSLLTTVGGETSSATLGQSMVTSGCWTQMLGSYTALGNETKVVLSVGGAEAGGDIWVAFAAAFDPPAAVLPKLASFAASATTGLVSYRLRSRYDCRTKGLVFCFCGTLVPLEKSRKLTLGSVVRELMGRSRLSSRKSLEIVACISFLSRLIEVCTLKQYQSDSSLLHLGVHKTASRKRNMKSRTCRRSVCALYRSLVFFREIASSAMNELSKRAITR